MIQRVGIVVPTLGKRPDYLEKCLKSIRSAGDAYIVLVAPQSFDAKSLRAACLIDSVVADSGNGLPAAVNLGMKSLPESIDFVNWLGDDDLLTQNCLEPCRKVLEENKQVVMVFGACEYINSHGEIVWKNSSGQWAVPLLRFGPDLIPQPGALFRKSSFEAVGGLDTNLGWAFDFDLFIKFSKIGKLKHLDQTLAQFRWHPNSLSVEYRKSSVAEASHVRVYHLPILLKVVSFIWEYPVRQATLIAGKRLTSRTHSKAKTK